MIKKYLNNLLNFYYPRNIEEHDSRYTNSLEYQRLVALCKQFHSDKFLVSHIEKELSSKTNQKFSYYGMGQNFPCYFFQSKISFQAKKEVICVAISFLGPFYDLNIINFENPRKLRVYVDSTDIMFIVKYFLENDLRLTQIPKKLLDSNIDFIQPLSKFTYFNAFFDDAYRVDGL